MRKVTLKPSPAGEQVKTIDYRFCEAKEPKQGAQGASVSSDAWATMRREWAKRGPR